MFLFLAAVFLCDEFRGRPRVAIPFCKLWETLRWHVFFPLPAFVCVLTSGLQVAIPNTSFFEALEGNNKRKNEMHATRSHTCAAPIETHVHDQAYTMRALQCCKGRVRATCLKEEQNANEDCDLSTHPRKRLEH